MDKKQNKQTKWELIKWKKEKKKDKIISEMKTKLQSTREDRHDVNLTKTLKKVRKTTKKMKTEIQKKKGWESKWMRWKQAKEVEHSWCPWRKKIKAMKQNYCLKL